MDLIFASLNPTSLQLFIDDLIIFNNSFGEHLKTLDQLFTRLNEVGLNCRRIKRTWRCRRVCG
mgnify:CR=1 FL=1